MPALGDYVQLTGLASSPPFVKLGSLNSLYPLARYYLITQSNGTDTWELRAKRPFDVDGSTPLDTAYTAPNGDNNDIRYVTSTGTWEDGDTTSSHVWYNPFQFSISGSTVELQDVNGAFCASFTTPYGAINNNNINTNANTSAFTASFINVTSSQYTWKVVHNTPAPSSVTYQLHSTNGEHATTSDPTFIDAFIVGPLAGNENSNTLGFRIYDVLEIRQMNGTVIASLKVPPGTKKKVHCNFW